MSGPGDNLAAILAAMEAGGRASVPGLGGVLDFARAAARAPAEQAAAIRKEAARLNGYNPASGPSIHSIGPVESVLGRIRGVIEPKTAPGRRLAGILGALGGEVTNPANLGLPGAATGVLARVEQARRAAHEFIPAVRLPNGEVRLFSYGVHNIDELGKVLGRLVDEEWTRTKVDPMGFVRTSEPGKFLTREETARAAGAAKGESSMVREAAKKAKEENPLPYVSGTEQYAGPHRGGGALR